MMMRKKEKITNQPIYYSSLVLVREFIKHNSDALIDGGKLYNLVSDSERFVLDTLQILQNITDTLETIDMAYDFICNGYEPLDNISIESYKFDVYHLDMFNNKMVTIKDLIYKLVSFVYRLSNWIREINKANHKDGAKFNLSFVNSHTEELRKKLNNDCLFSLLHTDLDIHLKSIIRDRNKSLHDGEINDYSYDGVALGILKGVEKGNMEFDNLKTLQYVARAMDDGHQKLIDDMKIHKDNAYEFTRVALCSISREYLKIIVDTLSDKYPHALDAIRLIYPKCFETPVGCP